VAPQIVILDIGSNEPEAEALTHAVIREAQCIYFHSIHAAAEPRLLQHLSMRNTRSILDAHGAPPEEAAMYLEYAERYFWDYVECIVMKHVSTIVVVTHAMASHLAAKHPGAKAKVIVMPILPKTADDPGSWERADVARPLLIYAGGMQKWQRISRMAAAISKLRSTCDYILLTSEVAILARQLFDAGLPPGEARARIRSVSHRQVLSFYEKAHYGFLLREDSIVNRVACPTKLIEYIAAGVVPILDSPIIGDFCELGMRFLPLAEMLSGRLPTWEERNEMARENLRVFERLRQEAKSGSLELARLWQ
jgi:hypothetical protein